MTAAIVLALGLLPAGGAADTTSTSDVKHYNVVLAGSQTQDGFDAAGSAAAVQTLIASADGTVVNDMTAQIGVLTVASANELFAEALRASSLVVDAGEDYAWKAFQSREEILAEATPARVPDSGPDPTTDPGEVLQWDMEQIRAPRAHEIQAGGRSVDVGILDTGIDGDHVDFTDADGSNVDCARGRNSIAFVPTGPGVGTPNPCLDNGFHGTHVAGTVGARANGLGIVGVAPNVTLVPVKVCDSSGYCYASAVTDGITYAGDEELDVINMSFFVDDNEFQQSTEFKCMDDPVQRTFRRMVERAIQYARSQGVTPVAALGNSDEDLAHPSEPNENNCEVVPAETQGVIGTSALGRNSEKAGYSNYGTGANDLSAPGGNGTTGDCNTTVLSTFPGNLYLCIQGTSMASPHTAGVAALIVSEFGQLGSDGDVKLSPTKVEAYLQGTTVDIGESGYDECFGNGRIDALRAVQHDTSNVYDASAPFCPEYGE
ncbi:MAG TPA: S8 family serine peptidase [Gaiellaceae bacterium]|nr:S8 family serine peptidase [Gaiellaceae bacterium]